MKNLFLILGFVVFWRQWEVVAIKLIDSPETHDVALIRESRIIDTLEDARAFVARHSKDERYTDMHIYRIGEEVK